MSVSGPGDLGFELLPPDPAAINPDLALDAALAPVVDYDVPAELPYGKGWQFDFLANQFVKHGSSPAEAYDLDNLAQWVEKSLRTARYAHPIYSDEFGIDQPFDLIGEVVDGDMLAEYEQAIEEALLVHDRIVAVEDFAFFQDPTDDGLYASFSIVLDAPGDLSPQALEFSQVQLGSA